MNEEQSPGAMNGPGQRIFVAVVDRLSANYRSGRPEGDFAAFIGQDRRDVIQRALRARAKWGAGTYRVLVGELTGEAVEPARYEIVPLGGGEPW